MNVFSSWCVMSVATSTFLADARWVAILAGNRERRGEGEKGGGRGTGEGRWRVEGRSRGEPALPQRNTPCCARSRISGGVEGRAHNRPLRFPPTSSVVRPPEAIQMATSSPLSAPCVGVSLPHELLERIFSVCNPPTLAAVAAVDLACLELSSRYLYDDIVLTKPSAIIKLFRLQVSAQPW